MTWETAIMVIGALGGLEFIKYIATRKASKRVSDATADSAESQADSDEFHVLRETIEFLQEQLKEKEERFAEQTKVMRSLNSEIISITDSKNDEILKLTEQCGTLRLELQKYRCVVPKCAKREPQNGY